MLDIKLTQSGAAFEPNGAVTVTIPVPKGFSSDSVAVYHLKNGSTAERLNSSVSGGRITFRVDSFSKFVIAKAPGLSSVKASLTGTVDLCRGGTLAFTVYSGSAPDFVRQGNGGVASVNAPARAWNTATGSSVWTVSGLGGAGLTGIYVSVGGVKTKLFEVTMSEASVKSDTMLNRTTCVGTVYRAKITVGP